ncbi:hypothetical protein FB451DRAFT_1058333 [Mycena latifolia]|nr:hypothetical protein FB451DRAFT_1058333 [Mycena latifolia]
MGHELTLPSSCDILQDPSVRCAPIIVERFNIFSQAPVRLCLPVRHTSADVHAPDDELIYIPGRWAYNLTDSGLRITQIYVSTNVSVFNGRANWNIPKHFAVFNFADAADGSTTVTVSPPDNLSNPHFRVKLTPAVGPIPIQVNTALTGDYLTLIQPALPASPTNPVEIGTTSWQQLLLNGKSPVPSSYYFILTRNGS